MLIEIINKIIRLDFPGMAAEMAFGFTFSMFPFFIFLISIFGLLGSENLITQIIQTVSFMVPIEITNLIETVLKKIIDSSNIGLLTIGFVISIWSASNAANIILKSVNKTYNIEETRPFWKLRLLAIVIVFVLVITLFISINLIVLGKTILAFFQNFIIIPGYMKYSLLLVRWPISFLTLFLMTLFVYYVAPNIKNEIKTKLISIIPGTMFFCLFWLLGSWIFSLYIENFGNYNETFGLLGGVMILLTWLYYSSFIVLTGGVINSEYYEKIK